MGNASDNFALFIDAPVGMCVFSGPDHTFLYANTYLLTIFFGGARAIVGKPIRQAMPELEGQGFIELLDQVYSSGETFIGKQMPARVLQSDGNYREMFVDFINQATHDQDGNVNGIAVVATDVTPHVMALREAEEANAMKSAFLANMSHEIRTPLGAILGFSGLLKDPGLSQEERNQYIDTINRNGQSLTRIIDDILDLAKVEAGRLDIEKIGFSLLGLMNEVIALFQDKVNQKRIAMELELDPKLPSHILGDPTRLRQVLINLLGNAVKFTDSGGIKVRVGWQGSSNPHRLMHVEVEDTGRGMNAEQMARLFRPFTQADNTTTRQFGGTGLGLALSKRMAQALGGDIGVVSSIQGKGSTFRFTFQAEEVRGPEAPFRQSENAAQLPRLSGIKVLLVDDSPDNRFLVERVLAKNGADVLIGTNGLEAVSLAREKKPDIVLMDIQMPQMDGYQATKILLEGGFNRPIIALTAHAMKEERLKTKAAGFAGHLTKPLNNQELIETIAKLAKV